jgi:hypothetical protein
LETFNKEQLRKRQVKQNNATARAAVYLENNDINGMFALVQEIQHNGDLPYELAQQDADHVTDHHQE